jgi:hypothetical protein
MFNYFFGDQTLIFHYRNKRRFFREAFGEMEFWTFINVHFRFCKKLLDFLIKLNFSLSIFFEILYFDFRLKGRKTII